MAKYPIPEDALDDRLAFVGTSGSGKTYAAGTAVERLLQNKARVVIVDPLDVWYGLRLKKDGKSEAFPVVIFGGAKGDLPITEQSGAVIGETVASMAESCIVSIDHLPSMAARRRFMLAFLDRLYHRATGEPFHLIVDEADMFAPQKSSEPELQSLMEQIVRRGRVKGFLPWLITQRPAVLSKDVLSQADGLVAMKLTLKHDRAAIAGWVETTADPGQWKTIDQKLPTLKSGSAFIWIPARDLLEGVTFPAKTTFDSSRTPKRGEVVRTAALKPVNLDAVKAKLAAIEGEKAKPKSKTSPVPATSAAPATPVIDARAQRELEERARRAGWEEGRPVFYAEGYRDALKHVAAAIASVKAPDGPIALPAPKAKPIAAAPAPRPAAQATPADDGRPLTKAERLVLTALAQYPAGRRKTQIAILTGYSHSAGGFNNALSSLRTRGCIEGTSDIRITEHGFSVLGPFDPLPKGDVLLDQWLQRLSKAERAALEALAGAWPGSLNKAEVAQLAGYEATGGGFNNALSRLRTLELISGIGELKASDDLFDTPAGGHSMGA